jgi:hypothetical protein
MGWKIEVEMAAIPFGRLFSPHILYEKTCALAPGLLSGGQPETGQQQFALAGSPYKPTINLRIVGPSVSMSAAYLGTIEHGARGF